VSIAISLINALSNQACPLPFQLLIQYNQSDYQRAQDGHSPFDFSESTGRSTIERGSMASVSRSTPTLSSSLTWRVAFSDKTTGVSAVPQCLTSGDIFGDGSHRILIVSLDQKLICFEGQRMTHELTLPDMPSSVCVHYNCKSANGIPLVAVGAGNAVFFFLNLRQYSKFSLPPPFKSPEEGAIYEQFNSGALNIVEIQQELLHAKERDVPLSSQSLAFIQADISRKSHADRYRQVLADISSTDCVTALAVIQCNAMNNDHSTRLLVGTESRVLLLLDQTDSQVEKKWDLGSPASVIRTSGYLSGSSIIVVITRDRNLRVISNLTSVNSRPCESLPVDVAICGESIYVALMSQKVNIFESIENPSSSNDRFVGFYHHIISLVAVEVENRQLDCCCVATANGELTFIAKTERINNMQLDEGISALYFGTVGREPYNLLSISKHGGLFLRTLSRIVQQDDTPARSGDDPPAAIPVPKKTRLFLDKCDAEKKNYAEMYAKWRDSLRYIYLLSANTYAKILEDSIVSPIDDVTFSVKILGMGPSFVMNVATVNSGNEVVSMVKVIPKYNPELYTVKPIFVDLPAMVGGYKYTARFVIKSLDREGKSGTINVVATSPQYPIPLCSSIVQVPVSQFPTEH
jgi:Bardet-Biedl syndrome 1 protein